MDSSDDEEEAAPVAAAPEPVKETPAVVEAAPAPVAAAPVSSAAPPHIELGPAKLICGDERGMDTDVLDIMDESGMCMDSSDEEDVASVAAAPKPVAAPVES